MATIQKKIPPQHFNLIKSGKKKFELRVADFKIKEGDILVLKEWDTNKKLLPARILLI